MNANQTQGARVGPTAPTWLRSALAVGRVRSHTGMALGLIVALAFALRAGAYLESPRPYAGAGLAATQAEVARNIVDRGKWFVVNPKARDLLISRQVELHRLVDPKEVNLAQLDRSTPAEPVISQMPGVALVLAALWWPTDNESYAPLQWLQVLVDTVLVLLIYWIGLRLTRNVYVSLLAALLYAIWPAAIVVDRRPVPDTWGIFFTVACVAEFVWARERPASRWRLITLGLITGAGIYFRPFILLLPVALAAVATPQGGWRRRLLWATIPTVVALLVLAPWTARNYYEFHRFIPTRTGLGQAVFQGAGLGSGDENSAKYVHAHTKDATYGSPKFDGVLWKTAVREIEDHPGPYLKNVAHRARFLLPCLLALLVWRRWRSGALILLAAAAVTVVPYMLIGDDTRFYLPAAFAYCILAAMAGVQVGMLVRRAIPRVAARIGS